MLWISAAYALLSEDNWEYTLAETGRWCQKVLGSGQTQRFSLRLLCSARHYFVSSPFLPSNPGEQFYMFTIISAWLINTAGRPFTEPQEHDEPNATVSAILAELRALVSKLLTELPHSCSVVEIS